MIDSIGSFEVVELEEHVKYSGNLQRIHPDVRRFISDIEAIDDSRETALLKTTTKFNITSLDNGKGDGRYTNVVNLKRINDILDLNDFLSSINSKLKVGGKYVGCVETSEMRTHRIVNKYVKPLSYLYLIGDFVFKRVFPKLPVFSQIYFKLTAGRNRVMTEVEVLGRLYYCGYKVVKKRKIDKYLVFVVEKTEHKGKVQEKRYGPLLTLKRIGYQGKLINVYKMRTMHAYSEYLQEYIYERNKLAEGGKIKNDFRVTFPGLFMRKFWLDELPMVYNFFKGQVKLVGVRPLSQHFLSLYPKEVQELRVQVKPGLIPPFYADLPKTLEEVVASEKRYIEAYKKAPLKTDMRYLGMALKKIFIDKARSK